MNHSIVLSIHIPRTGGTSLKDVLSSIYKNGFVWMQQAHSAQETYEKLKGRDWNSIQCIHGHIGYGLHNFIPNDITCQYITFLRDPRERILSLYNFIFREETYNVYKWDKYCNWNKDIDFATWLKDKKLSMQDNQMVRFFSGRERLNIKTITRSVGYEDYALAIIHLDKFFFIGLTEHFDKCLSRLSSILNWGKTPKAQKIYSYPNRKHFNDLTKSEKDLIENTQYYDLLLYKHYAESICAR